MNTEETGRALVIVPAWNEERVIGETLAELMTSQPDVDVLVVDDGSTDRTRDIALSTGAAVCSLPFNLGVGGAMRTGYRYALRHGYELTVQFDADGQHDPRRIDDLLASLSDANIVIGARFAGEGDYRVGFSRKVAMTLLAGVLSRLAGSRLTDVTSGFRAADRKAMESFAHHYPAEYLGDTVEALVIAMRRGCHVSQVPVTMRARRGGAASQSGTRSVVFLARAVVALGLALVRRWTLPHEQVPPKLDVEPAASLSGYG